MKSRLLVLVTAAGIAITGAVLVVPTGAIANPPRTAGAVQSSDTDAASSCRQGAARCPFYLYDYGHRRDGAFGANIEYSLLSYATRGRSSSRSNGFEFTRQRLNAITVWFDVSRRNSGPEYVFDQEFAADGDGHTGRWVGKVDTWGWNGSDPVHVPKAHARELRHRCHPVDDSAPLPGQPHRPRCGGARPPGVSPGTTMTARPGGWPTCSVLPEVRLLVGGQSRRLHVPTARGRYRRSGRPCGFGGALESGTAWCNTRPWTKCPHLSRRSDAVSGVPHSC